MPATAGAAVDEVATVEDGPDERVSLVRHGWGPARFDAPSSSGDAGAVLGPAGGSRAPAPGSAEGLAGSPARRAGDSSQRVYCRP